MRRWRLRTILGRRGWLPARERPRMAASPARAQRVQHSAGRVLAGWGLPVHGWSVAATQQECHWHSNAAEELVNMRVSEMPCFRAVTCGSRHFGTVMFRSSHVSEQSMSRNSHVLERSCFGSGRHASLTTHAPCSVSRHPCEQSCFGGWREQPCADLVSSHLSDDGVTSHVV